MLGTQFESSQPHHAVGVIQPQRVRLRAVSRVGLSTHQHASPPIRGFSPRAGKSPLDAARARRKSPSGESEPAPLPLCGGLSACVIVRSNVALSGRRIIEKGLAFGRRWSASDKEQAKLRFPATETAAKRRLVRMRRYCWNLMLLGPFGGQVGEASNPHAMRQPPVDSRLD